MLSPKSDIRYPRLSKRLQAALLDVLIFVCVLSGLVYLLLAVDFPGGLKATIVAFVVLTLEPGLVCTTGGTIGHHALGLRIQDERTGSNLSLFLAVVRFFAKSLFGWLSFIFVLVTRRHQAIHDMLSASVVTIRNPVGIDGIGELPEREIYLAEFEYPSGSRRVLIILLYIVVLLLLIGGLFELTLTEGCMKQDKCNVAEAWFEIIVSLGWVGCIVAILVFGWTGRLPGAKRKARTT